MSKFPLIALAGFIGSGKTEAAKYLRDRHGYKIIKFAEPIKDMLRAIGLTEAQINGDEREVPLAMLCGKTPREFMQKLGTEFGRKMIGENIWANIWKQKVLDSWAGDKVVRVVADDCRFANEGFVARELGGVVIKVYRPGVVCSGHESEVSVKHMLADHLMDNDGEIEKMQAWLDKLVAGTLVY